MTSELTACRNPEHRPWWWVSKRRHNVSAFNGYAFTPSDYSTVSCAAPLALGACDPVRYRDAFRTFWRTKAKFVDDLPDRAPIEVPA